MDRQRRWRITVMCFALSSALTLTAQADEKSKRVRLNTARAIRMNYGLPAWNKNPKKIESASMLIREGKTGRLVQIQLQETAPDSSIFSGIYSVTWEKMSEVQPELYAVPNAELLSTPQGLQKISSMIQKGEIRRLPFILRRAKDGTQNVEVYDTKEQAHEAMKAFRAEQQAIEFQNKKILSDADAEVANLAMSAAERETVARNSAERVRLEQIEAKKIEEAIRKFQNLNPTEKKQQQANAAALAAEAMSFFSAGNFKDAAAKMEQAILLDPINKTYFFQYGIVLHRIADYNRSIVYLSWANGPQVNVDERHFYLGLDYFQLKEYQNAKVNFQKAAELNQPATAGSSQFYVGLITYEQKKWDEAQNAFQKVLDISQDPNLDKQAETYIELILRAKQFESEKAKKWTLSLTLGEQYDSNILSSSDSALDQGTATNSAGYRSLIMQGTKYRAMYETDRELSLGLDILYMYSVDKSFAVVQSLRNSDPLLLTFTAPYTRKSVLFGKGYKFDLIPGYEQIYMSVEDNTNKDISNTFILSLNNLLVMSERWFANFNLENRLEDSLLNSSTGDNNADALKVKLTNSNIIFAFEDKAKILLADVSYTMNHGQGKNVIYNRYDLGLGMIGPAPWEISWNAKIAYYNLSYTQKSDNRLDNDYAFTGGLSRKLAEWLNGGLTATYTVNNSNVDASQYKKYSVMFTLSTSKAF